MDNLGNLLRAGLDQGKSAEGLASGRACQPEWGEEEEGKEEEEEEEEEKEKMSPWRDKQTNNKER